MRERLLKLSITAHQRVIFLIGDLGCIIGMIKLVMMRNLTRKPH